LEVAANIDVRRILPVIRVPTLILHRAGDKVMRVEGARYMAQQIPNAKYVELSGSDHWWWVGETDILLAEVEMLLRTFQQVQPPVLSNRILVTLLQVEIRQPDDSQSMLWIDGVPDYLAFVRGEIAHFRGRLTQQSEGNILAMFDGPSRALQCALTLGQAAHSAGIAVGLGLHAGECELVDDKLDGPMVQIVRGMTSNAPSGFVLLSSTVKELMTGSGFEFKPFAGPIQNNLRDGSLYELELGGA
jgi:class 3 adenylate cyclase